MTRPTAPISYWILGFTIVIALAQPAFALRKNQPWHVTTRAEPDAQAGGWFINLGITGARAKIELDAEILEVGLDPAAPQVGPRTRVVEVEGKLHELFSIRLMTGTPR